LEGESHSDIGLAPGPGMGERYNGDIPGLISPQPRSEMNGGVDLGATSVGGGGGAHLMRNPSFGQAGETMATTMTSRGDRPDSNNRISDPNSPFVEPGYWLTATRDNTPTTPYDENNERTSSVPASLSSRGNSTYNVDEFGMGNSSDKLMMGQQASQSQNQNQNQPQPPSSVSSHGHLASLGRNSSIGRTQSQLIAPLPLAQTPVPPTSFTFREKDQSSENGSSSATTLQGILGRLRGGRTSNPNIVIQGASSPSSAATSRESLTLRTQLHIPPSRSPSSLLHPTPMQSMFNPASLLQRPPSAVYPTAGRPGSMGPPPLGPNGERRGSFWPGAESLTLPSPPSPAPSERSRDLEGLLHPRIMFRLPGNQDSSASLRDDEDYSRPIGGVSRCHRASFREYVSDRYRSFTPQFVHNGIHHSTTTFDTNSIGTATEPDC
jgi:hypothetical protein